MQGGAGFLNHQQYEDKDETVIGQSGFPTVNMFIRVYPGSESRGNCLSLHTVQI